MLQLGGGAGEAGKNTQNLRNAILSLSASLSVFFSLSWEVVGWGGEGRDIVSFLHYVCRAL